MQALRQLSLSDYADLPLTECDQVGGAKKDVKGKMRRVVGELESVLGELKTVVGDLQTLVSQIDVVTTQIDRQCTPSGDEEVEQKGLTEGSIWTQRQMSAPLLDPPPITQPSPPIQTGSMTRSASHSANFFRTTSPASKSSSKSYASKGNKPSGSTTKSVSNQTFARVNAFQHGRKSSSHSDSATFWTSHDLKAMSSYDPWLPMQDSDKSYVSTRVIKSKNKSRSKPSISHKEEEVVSTYIPLPSTRASPALQKPPKVPDVQNYQPHRSHAQRDFSPSKGFLVVDHRGNNPKYYEHVAAEYKKSKATQSSPPHPSGFLPLPLGSLDQRPQEGSELPASSTDGEQSSPTGPSPELEYCGVYEKALDDCLEVEEDLYSSLESLPLGMEAQDASQTQGFYYTSAEDSGLCQLRSDSLSEDQPTSVDEYDNEYSDYDDNDGDDEGEYDVEDDFRAEVEHRSIHRNIMPKTLSHGRVDYRWRTTVEP